jgi:hypothetical protein
MSDQGPIESMSIVDRPTDEATPDMWLEMVDLCEADADLDALIAMREQAEGR